MMSEPAGWLPLVLEEYCQRNGVESFEPLVEEAAVAPLENYTGYMKRIRVRLRYKNGDTQSRSFVFKLCDGSDPKMSDVYSTELKVYQNALYQMEKQMKECGVEECRLWPELVGYRKPDIIGLEDLKESGYGMVDRQAGLDKAHAMLAIRGLAKFHAASKVCHQNGTLDPTIYRPSPFCGSAETFNDIMEISYNALRDITAPKWKNEFRDKYAELLEKLPKAVPGKLRKLFQEDRPDFKVFNHGDPWSNNMLFKYNEDTKQPESLKFVDFQLPHFSSFAMDVHYFLGTSLSKDAMSSEEELITEYHTALSSVLSECGYVGAVPTLEAIKEEMKATEFFRFFAACIILPVVKAMDDVLSEVPEGATGKNLIVLSTKRRYDNDEYAELVLDVFERFNENGAFDDL